VVVRSTSVSARSRSYAGRLLGVVIISFGIGGAAYITGRGSGSVVVEERPRAFVPEFNVIEVPVPDRPVGAGVAIRDIPVRLEKFPEHQLPSGVVRDIGRLRDSVTLVPLPGGLPILEVNIGSSDQASHPLTGRIPDGMRAMTVRVDVTAVVEGWARSGSVVDVLLVDKNRTQVVAEQVTILSAERSLSAGAIDNATGIPSTVTLLVTQDQCLAINTAVAIGKIAFALRSGSDSNRWDNTEFAATDLSNERTKKGPAKVQGIVSFGDGESKKSFALVDGRWIRSEDPLLALSSSYQRSGGEQ